MPVYFAPMNQSTNLAELYDEYYAPDESGSSVYSGRFGPYDIPLIDCLTYANQAANAVLKQRLSQLHCSEYDQEDFIDKLYSRRHEFENLSPAEFYDAVIHEIILARSLPHNSAALDISILDYGCGDGRYLKFYTSLAKAFTHLNVNLHVFNYDISKSGLEVHSSRAAEFGLVQSALAAYPHLKFGNLNLVMMHGDENDDPLTKTRWIIHKHAERHFGKRAEEPLIDVSVCNFGTLSHIAERTKRINTIKMLGHVTQNEVTIGFPTDKFLHGNPRREIVRHDHSTGVVHYAMQMHNGSRIEIPYVVYDGHTNIRQEIAAAGFYKQYLHSSSSSVSRPDVSSHSKSALFEELRSSTSSRRPEYEFASFDAGQIRGKAHVTNHLINSALGRFEYIVSPTF